MRSSRVTSAKRKTFWESANKEAAPVCVGVHSYPGLTQNARRYRPLRAYRSSMALAKSIAS
eukprot:389570-Rhodomonas_salina.1